MKSQAQALDEFSVSELMRATVKYDEVMQKIVQNQILVENGFWTKLICESTDSEIHFYEHQRQALIDRGDLNEDALRMSVINVSQKSRRFWRGAY